MYIFSVGKTSILERFVTDIYTEDYKATIGADFRTKDIVLNGQTVLLQIWDTGYYIIIIYNYMLIIIYNIYS